MTDIERIRAVAMLLPETEERGEADTVAFLVDGKAYAEVRGGEVRVRAADLPGTPPESDGAATWKSVALREDTDWVLVEDLVARGWEMTAPRRLLEAGGR